MSPSPTRPPWNKNKSIGQMKPFTAEEVRLIKTLLQRERKLRDLALFSTGVDTLLRSKDLLALMVSDVRDPSGKMRGEFRIRQAKTKQGVLVSLTEETQDVLRLWIDDQGKVPWDYLFTGLKGHTDRPLSRGRYRNLVKSWAVLARLDPTRYSTHSIRRTKASLIYEATGSVAIVQKLLGQQNIASTTAYLGIDEKKAVEYAKRFVL